jgi:hypothetical protein
VSTLVKAHSRDRRGADSVRQMRQPKMRIWLWVHCVRAARLPSRSEQLRVSVLTVTTVVSVAALYEETILKVPHKRCTRMPVQLWPRYCHALPHV